MDFIKEFLESYILYFLGVMSIVTFVLYGIDKGKAKMKRWRIPEKTLLGFGIFGGFIGGLAGMQLFHHKTRHFYFYVVNFIGAILWIFILYWLFC